MTQHGPVIATLFAEAIELPVEATDRAVLEEMTRSLRAGALRLREAAAGRVGVAPITSIPDPFSGTAE
ncbi:hypothetical protein [Arthrobacter zhaoguopingii]|uniref:hypothetical protein n=1 Tax=Arthrobacter zhaoguopingii TaxID=2681491 RepID=UPI00135C995F|nr:hypothetical protein [Arthrobacter zhaoguopingii]